MSYWKEIKNDYIRKEDDGFIVISIDAWRTGSDAEEGKVIAEVIGKKVKDEDVIHVSYRDYIAATDKYAQEVIAEAKKTMIAAINENQSDS